MRREERRETVKPMESCLWEQREESYGNTHITHLTSFMMGEQSLVFFIWRRTFANSIRSNTLSSASPRESTFFVISLISALTSLALPER